jgi:hypothetical protein
MKGNNKVSLEKKTRASAESVCKIQGERRVHAGKKSSRSLAPYAMIRIAESV